ncbi:hypothetical protein AN189_07245 [Loktanella sp. 3ANDIMAR09]|uniref:baseplate assembly protein n=1 Tax=Loktanella sp. 3ANDIMAR09 TaxID=1225657 RepID=UPI000700AABC|nr:baseplate J/gp47 family protein [Loktanella sp. 3ANDIMAR09]KQI68694.1 hypothetical protein AN189_07245 [Loktanella sp. 3ANDIMAR09]
MTSAINLAQLPPLDVIEALDFETVFSEMVEAVRQIEPSLSDTLSLESEPIVKVLQALAYRELLVRARVNDAARAVMLPTAQGGDLDNLASLFGVARLIVRPADPAAVPPIPAILESDADLRLRVQTSLEALSVAGPRGAYEFHARSVDGRIRDVSVFSDTPGLVSVIVYSEDQDGNPIDAPVAAVDATLNGEAIRPLCDTVDVVNAEILLFDVEAVITVSGSASATEVLAKAQESVAGYLRSRRRIGRVVPRSGLIAALFVDDVENVDLVSPAGDVEPSATQVPFAGNFDLT